MQAASFQRRFATRVGNFLARSLLHLGVKDYTHGFRGYSKSAFLECYNKQDIGGEYNLRLLVEAQKRGYRTFEVPYCSDHMGKSKMTTWLKYLWLLIAMI
jgi:hypothetical protein